MKVPWIQVSVDTQDIPAALEHVAHAIAIDAEWVEVGTPLLTFAGIEAIGAVAEAAKGRTVLADFKALDGVAQYFQRAGELGASVATVMAVANESSIRTAIAAGHKASVSVQVDMLGVPTEELADRARQLTDMGADCFLLHLAIDKLTLHPDSDPLEGLDELVAATDRPVGPVVFSAQQGVDAVRRGASYVVIGHPLINQPDARSLLLDFATTVRSVKSEVPS